MQRKITFFQKKVLAALAYKIEDFYLAGGTALSMYYFHHRNSLDLDFFTSQFNRKRILEVTGIISKKLNEKLSLLSEQAEKNKIRIMVYSLPLTKKEYLKIDFVEDYIKCLKSAKPINGIKIMSLEDIFLRKIYAIAGMLPRQDEIGNIIFIGGRQEAKDFYDLYCLSHIFMRLSKFSFTYGNRLMREALVRWFHTYNRFDIKTGLLELRLAKENIEYNDIERHFKKEIDKIIEKEIGDII